MGPVVRHAWCIGMSTRRRALGEAMRQAVEREIEARRLLREARAAQVELCRSARAEQVPLTALARSVLLAQRKPPTPAARRRVAVQLRQLRRRGVTDGHAVLVGPASPARADVRTSMVNPNQESPMPRMLKKTVYEFELNEGEALPAGFEMEDDADDTDEDAEETDEEDSSPAPKASPPAAKGRRKH